MLAGRTSARTLQPWASRSAATWPPMNPVAPVTSAVLTAARPSVCSRPARSARPALAGGRAQADERGELARVAQEVPEPAAGGEPPGRVHDQAVEVGEAVAASRR